MWAEACARVSRAHARVRAKTATTPQQPLHIHTYTTPRPTHPYNPAHFTKVPSTHLPTPYRSPPVSNHITLPPPTPAPSTFSPHKLNLLQTPTAQEPTRFYHILTGSPGTGKTTLVREACAATGGGVGYVDVSPAFEVDFGSDLGSAFNFR